MVVQVRRASLFLFSSLLLVGCAQGGFRPAPPPDNRAVKFTVICDLPGGGIVTHTSKVTVDAWNGPIWIGDCDDDYVFREDQGEVTRTHDAAISR
jgi:hypothetical protein